MSRRTGGSPWTWMAVIVLVHLIASIAHGATHTGAQITMPLAANLFVFIVILAGPVAGVALWWWSKRLGSLVVVMTMAGSLLFGLVNHFVLQSPDHVSHVAAQWRLLFGTTAALLALIEMLGVGFVVRLLSVRRAP